MRVFVQQKRGEFPNINYYQAWLGFRELGHDTALLEEDEFASIEFGPDCMPVGEIPLMLASFAKVGVGYAHLRYIPPELLPFADRRIWTSTLKEVRQSVADGNTLFTKPLEGTPRRFKGQVLRAYRDLIRTASCEPDMPVWCSELVDFVSEYRVFVMQKDVVGLKHYAGDFRVFPDFKVIDTALSHYQTQPAGFGIDFAVTRDGRTLIVEQNDGFSIGCYGLHQVTYANLLEARWSEIMG
jgi:hypothetical protein